MTTYVILSTMETDTLSSPGDFTKRASNVNDKINQEFFQYYLNKTYCT
jgi:hypothetical protein